MHTKSYWRATSERTPYTPLSSNLSVDVLVIGGGITGVTTAYLLQKAGKSVALIERDEIARGETGFTTAHLTYATDTRLSELVAHVGKDHANAAWHANYYGMLKIGEIVQELGIECELQAVPNYLVMAKNTDWELEIKALREDEKLAREFGFDCHYEDSLPPYGLPGIVFANNLKLHPLLYIRAVAQAAVNLGARIFEGTNADEFQEKPSRCITSGGTITYQHVVMATHVPLQGNASTTGATLFQTKLYLYSTYALHAKIAGNSIPALLWSDTGDPFNYLRTARDNSTDEVILGGEDHKTGQEPDPAARFEKLEQTLQDMFPGAVVQHRWSGQVIETLDGLPYIGEVIPGQFIATGFSGNGTTFGTLSAVMAHDHVMGIKNPWEALFAPHRKAFSAAWDYVKENKDYPYYMARDFMTKGEEGGLESLQSGEGKILRYHGKRVAAYRDEQGTAHTCSAVCTHMGCLVSWNDAEKTWDCPCHGSRFEATGKVMHGPAERDLERV